MSHSSLGAHAAKGVKLTLVGQWSKFGLQLISMVLLSRLLTPHEFGVYALALVFVGAGQLVSDFGLSAASIQAEHITSVQQSNLFWINTFVGIVLGSALALTAPIVARFYGTPELAPVLTAVGGVFLVQAMTTQFLAHATRSLRFRLLMASDVSAQLVGAIAAIAAALAGAGAWALVLQQAVIAVWTITLLALRGGWRPGPPGRAPMRWILQYGANTFGVQLLNYLSANVDSIAIGRVLGPAQLGLYDKGYQFLKLPMQQIATPLTRVALPVLSRHQRNREEFSRLLVVGQTGLAYGLGCLFAVSAGLAQAGLPLILGSGWAESATIYQILVLGGFFQAMGYVYYWAFLALGLTGVQLRYSIITRVLMIIAILAAVSFGIQAVAWAVTLGLITNWVVLTAFPMRTADVGVARLVRTALRPMILHAAVFVTLAVFVWSTTGMGRLLVCLVGLVVAFVGYASAFLLFPSCRKDFDLIRRIAKRSI